MSDSIDRISPTLEPDQPVLFHQNWLHLLFLHWEIPAAELQTFLPPQLTLDTFEGKAYVGLLPFTMTGVRPVFTPPMPWLSSFHEINLRTYVHLKGRDPGVWFFSLDASSSLAVTLARSTFHLPYYDARIEFDVAKGALPECRFASTRDDVRSANPAHARMTYRPVEGPSFRAVPGTLEHFLIERYILYASEGNTLYRARVHHAPYEVHRAEVMDLDETIVWAAGVKRSEAAPIRHYSPGVEVKIYPLEKVG